MTRLTSQMSWMSGEVLAQADTAGAGQAAGNAAAAAGDGAAAVADGAAAVANGAAAVADMARDPNLLIPNDGSFWLPGEASVGAGNVDWLFHALVWLSIVCFVGITIAVVYFTVKYRARPGHKPQPSAHHNDVVETIWTVIPALICVALFVGGWRGYVDLSTPPKHALEVQVTARKWSWEFVHPNGVKDSVLHVPAGRSVRLVMKSEDVIHSFFVPDFRIKKDVVPRRYTQVWFKAEQPTITPDQEIGDLPTDEQVKVAFVGDKANKTKIASQQGRRLFCTEYCGRDHSMMKTRVVVHNPGGYDRYLAFKQEEQDQMPPLERGQDVYARLCFACHTVDGSARVGPSFAGVFGTERTFVDGTSVIMDENYIRESLVNPQGQVVQGYPPSMPSFQGQLSEKEIDGVITYIKSLK
ncbi:cytochrome c oxidase subunit II [Haliangium sp.]|uniref:cytochrome c oxidase subunit II n=1 Tax=Haliangium sp. TaxID=2663208 RepID=UPI003D11F21B